MRQSVAKISRRNFAVVLVVSLAIHLGVAVGLFWQKPSSGTPNTGIGGIEIGLGLAGSAPGTVEEAPAPTEEADVLEATEVTEEVRETEIAEEQEVVAVPPVSTETPVEVVEEQVATTEVIAEPMVEVEAEIPVEVEAEAPVEIVAEAVEAKPVEEEIKAVTQEVVARKVPEPPRSKPVSPRKTEPVKKEVLELKPAETAAPTTTAKSVEPEVEPTSEPGEVLSTAGTDGRSGTKDQSAAGSGDSTAGGGQPGATADFSALIQAWLEKHKKYPRRARTRRQQGTAILSFVIDRQGNVLDYRITKSSGHRLLDSEVADMIERANPVPTMPAEMRGDQMELVVPVAFFLR